MGTVRSRSAQRKGLNMSHKKDLIVPMYYVMGYKDKDDNGFIIGACASEILAQKYADEFKRMFPERMYIVLQTTTITQRYVSFLKWANDKK